MSAPLISTATKADETAQQPTTPSNPGRVGFWALAIGFTAFVAWAALAPLDEGVPAPASVSIDTKRQTIQHLSGGIIREVLVREGQIVTEGQPLIRLDQATARANLESIRQRYLGLRAMQGRLQAEQAQQPTINWHPDLKAAQTDPQISQQINTQQQLLSARRGALAADLQSIDESIQGLEELIHSYNSILQNRLTQQSLLKEEHQNIKSLVEQGYAPRTRQLELERTIAANAAETTDVQANIQRSRRSIAELRQRTILRQQEYRKEVESQLADVTREVQSDAEKIKAIRDEFDRTEIRSPSAGQVVGLAFQTPGGVIPPGQKILDIVPENQPLLIEAQVPPHLIDRVTQGQTVDARFSTFAHSPQLVVTATVQSVSSDLLTEPRTGASYYLARIAITPDGMKKLGRHQLQSGMPVDVVFKGGERSLLTYLLHPLTKRIAASLTEE
jgi:membrane fusion protein, protease secretion system